MLAPYIKDSTVSENTAAEKAVTEKEMGN